MARVVTNVATEEATLRQAGGMTYGAWLDGAGFNTPESRIQVGDIICLEGDTFFGSVNTTFATARNGCTVWIDFGNTVPIAFQFYTSTGVWNKSLTEPITFRPLGGQVKIEVPEGWTHAFHVKDLGNVIVDGENNYFPGLRSPFATSNFLHGTFGFMVSMPTRLQEGMMCFAVHCQDHENFNFNIRGCEAIDGFAGFRSQLGNGAGWVHNGTVTVRRCYRHDSHTGEGLYFGYTGDENNGVSKIAAIIEDNIFVRAAAESTQIQHTIRGTSMARNINVMAAADWMNPFQPWQDSCFQQLWADGDIVMRDNISDGWGTGALSLFGSNSFTDPAPLGPVRWKNSYFGGGYTMGYRQASLANGLEMHFEDLIINDMTEHVLERPDQDPNYTEYPVASPRKDWFFPANRGFPVRDIWKFKDIKYTTQKTDFFEGEVTNIEEQNGFVQVAAGSVAQPSYINLGITTSEYRGTWHPHWFQENTRYSDLSITSVPEGSTGITDNGGGTILVQVHNVYPDYAHYLAPGDKVMFFDMGVYANKIYTIDSTPSKNTLVITTPYLGGDTGQLGRQISYTAGSVVSYFGVGFPARGFYKVILNHTVGALTETPDVMTSNYEKLYWDVNGVRSDNVAYTGTPDATTGGHYPPDNLLLEDTDPYFQLDMGVGMQANDPRYSKYKWYIADNATGTINKILIYGAKELTFNIDDDRYTWVKRQVGRYIIGSVAPVDSLGNIGDEVFATGVVIGVGSVAPVLLTQTVENATPTDVVMVFSKIVNGTNLGFTLSGTTETTFASISGFGTDTLTGVLATAILGTENPLLNYSSILGDIVDVDATPLVSFSNKVIQNNVFTVPVVESMIVNNSNANEWVANFDIPVTNTTIAGWSFKIDGVAATITGVAGTGTNQLTFTATETVLTGEVLLGSYDPSTGNCIAVDGGLELALFTDDSVINGVGASKIDIVWDSGSITPIPPNTGVNVFVVKQSTALTNLVDQNNVATVLSIQRTLGTPSNLATGAACTDARWDAAMSLESDYTSSSVTYTISGLGASEVVDLSIFSSISSGGTMAYWLQGVKQTEFNCGSNTAVKVYTGIIANASGEITIEVDEVPGTAFASINCLGIDRA